MKNKIIITAAILCVAVVSFSLGWVVDAIGLPSRSYYQAQHLTDSIRIEYLDGRIYDSLNYAR